MRRQEKQGSGPQPVWWWGGGTLSIEGAGLRAASLPGCWGDGVLCRGAPWPRFATRTFADLLLPSAWDALLCSEAIPPSLGGLSRLPIFPHQAWSLTVPRLSPPATQRQTHVGTAGCELLCPFAPSPPSGGRGGQGPGVLSSTEDGVNTQTPSSGKEAGGLDSLLCTHNSIANGC